MTVSDFLTAHTLCPDQISAESCLNRLLSEMEKGLREEGNIPMLPSYLSSAAVPPRSKSCCVLDVGGTNFRAALATFDETGQCHIHNLRKSSMPGIHAPMSRLEFYTAIADQVRAVGCTEQIGFCFSYNVLLNRGLDGILLAWCKEVQVPEAVGYPVGASLKEALGNSCRDIHVLNDSVAAMLGASTPEAPVQVGIILGTGINVCYEEPCQAIPKVENDLRSSGMIISTEIGEFDGFPKSDFDLSLFADTEEPGLAHAEKQCAGGYLGDLICRVWNAAAAEGVLEEKFRHIRCSLAEISVMLEGSDTWIPKSRGACLIAETLIHRAAKIAAVLCAGPVLRCTPSGSSVTIAAEGSQFHKLSGFQAHFRRELAQLLSPRNISFTFVSTENACLKGAALAAFAQKM